MPKADPREWPLDAYPILFEALSVEGRLRFGAFYDDELVGVAAFKPPNELTSLAVKYPSRGIGRALVEMLLEHADIDVLAEKRAESFYEALGFIHKGYERGLKRYAKKNNTS